MSFVIVLGFVLLIAFMVMGLPVIYSFGVCVFIMLMGLGYDFSFSSRACKNN